MSTTAPHPEANHPCHHPDCCPSVTEMPATATQGGEVGLHQHEAAGHTRGALKRWGLWFLTFFGIYASSSVCPFCGTPGCPVGAGGAALVGGFFAVLWQYGKNIWERLQSLVTKGAR